MSRRIDVELTSDRGDGTWSWRAAGARQPKGVLDAALLYEGARVGDVVRAEADFDIEGITVTSVQAPKGARREPERIEVRGPEQTFTPITSSLTGKARERAERGEDDRPRRGRDDRGPRPGGAGGPGGRPGGRPGGPSRVEGDRGPRPGGDRPDRSSRPPRPAPPAPKPKAKKLRPQRVHREALLASLSPEQQPIAEQLLRGGMPAVRIAVEEQNAKAKAEDGLEVPVDTVLGIAEQLVTRARVADWLDRAEAARATGEELALRDLRSVVSTADDVARDESTRELAAELKSMLEQRTESEQRGWLSDIEASLAGGRVVRALRLSSRPPEPGNTFPAELTVRLTEAANGALSADIASDRWATVLDAVAYSPIRRSVAPAGVPPEPTEELLVAVRKHAGRTPAIAVLFGIEPPADTAKGPKRPTKAAGRNPNLSRAGGPRGATVPVPGRPGGPPVPPAKRIPPPPGRQIGATLPGSAPVPPPPPAERTSPDPTTPLTPPSATGAAEPAASVGTPAATPADLEPVAPTGGEQPAPTEGASAEGASSSPAPTGSPDAGSGAAPEPAGPEPFVADAPEAEVALDAALTLTDGPGPEATAGIAAAAFDPSSAGGQLPPATGAEPSDETRPEAAPQDAPQDQTTPEGGIRAAAEAPPEGSSGPPDVALDAALTLTDGPEPEATAVIAAAAFDAPSAAGEPEDGVPTVPAGAEPAAAVGVDEVAQERAAELGAGSAQAAPVAAAFDAPVLADPAPTPAPAAAPAAEPDATAPPTAPVEPDPLVASASGEAGDVLASGPSDSSLPDPAPTADPGLEEEQAPAAERAAELDTMVSQAASGPFEPPADPPVEDAPNSGVGTVAAQRGGGETAPAADPGGGEEQARVAEQAAELDAVVSQAASGPFEPPADPAVEDAPNSGVGTVAAEQEGGRPPEDAGTT